METKTLNGIIIFCMGILFACVLLGGTKVFQNNIDKSSINEIDILNNPLGCANLSLIETSNCLNKELSSWWKYNISNLYAFWPNKKIDWETIKKDGGVCWQSSEWYNRRAKDLGFSAKEISFGEDEGHSYSLIWDKQMTEYCILDQQVKPTCYKIGGQDE